MELSHKAEVELAASLKKLLARTSVFTDVVVCPSYPSLPAVAEVFEKSQKVGVGAQHIHWEEKGAVTGAVSVRQVSPFARWCIVGHSEVRVLSGITDEQVQMSAALLIRHGLTAVVCIGESWEERQREETIARVTHQVETLMAGITRPGLSKLVIVYEPIWAISAQGRGEMPLPAEVAEMALLVRKLVAERYGAEGADQVRILYGGNVKPDNAGIYMGEPGVDGALVGSASTKAMQFFEIIKAAAYV